MNMSTILNSGSRTEPAHPAELIPAAHSMPVAYLLWVFGFTGAHRFYLGRPVSGTVYFFTFGLLGIGWVLDAFLIPGLHREALREYSAPPIAEGSKNFNIAWALLTFFGVFGLHRFYLGKWVSGLIYFCTGGLFTLGVIYDFWTLNEQVVATSENGGLQSSVSQTVQARTTLE
jgi:TM2 domain-containing membrane protein YozV